MQEDKRPRFQDFDRVFGNAQLRRSADLGLWLKQYLEQRRQARLTKVDALDEDWQRLTIT